MAKDIAKELSDDLYQQLQTFDLVLLSTIFENSQPFVNAISWVYAPSTRKIRFSVDSKSQIIANIKANKNVTMTIFSGETIYSIIGQSNILTEEIEGIPFKLAIVEVEVESVHEVMFYGSKIISLPSYEKTYNPTAAEKLDQQVLNALKDM